MKTTICYIRKFLGMGDGSEDRYVTEHEYFIRYSDNPKWVCQRITIDIPERFKPMEDLEGRVLIAIDGKRMGLGNALGIGGNGEPCIEWFDEGLGCKRRVSLKESRI